jgi:DDE family transposase
MRASWVRWDRYQIRYLAPAAFRNGVGVGVNQIGLTPSLAEDAVDRRLEAQRGVALPERLEAVLPGDRDVSQEWSRYSAELAACVDDLTEALRAELPDYGVDVAIDASDLPAYANGQRFLYNHGPERQAYSDPDASWGHRSAVSTRKGGGFYGYKLHLAVCTRTGLPLAWRIETARRNESLDVASLLDAILARGWQPATCAMDKGTTTTG